MAKSDGRCGECGSSDLAVESVREVRRPNRKGDPKGVEQPVVARQIWVRCRRCRFTDCILRRVDDRSASAAEPPAPDAGRGR